MEEEIDALKEWASKRARSASTTKKKGTKRSLKRKVDLSKVKSK
jgi:hypothetical protein